LPKLHKVRYGKLWAPAQVASSFRQKSSGKQTVQKGYLPFVYNTVILYLHCRLLIGEK
jgi:hypothetical protein